MKYLTIVATTLFIFNTTHGFAQTSNPNIVVNNTLDAWHKAAADANFQNYFKLMTFFPLS